MCERTESKKREEERVNLNLTATPKAINGRLSMIIYQFFRYYFINIVNSGPIARRRRWNVANEVL